MSKANEPIQRQNEPGIVISYFGNSVLVESQNGQVIPCHLKRNQTLPVVGDRVEWQWENDESGVILRIEERRSLLGKGGKNGKIKPIAANIDTILIVMAPPPIFSEYLIDRYLIAAELLHIQAVLVLNKVDLLTGKAKKIALERLASYKQISYPVIATSVIKKNGLRELNAYLQGRTGVLVGPSGVGKSSIIAALTQQEIRTGEVTNKGGGKHTTTATRLYHLAHGGYLIDSPGVREFSLWEVGRAEIVQCFIEFSPYVNECKFRDCKHLVEPGCAVQKAVQAGKISATRYESYQTLLKEAASPYE